MLEKTFQRNEKKMCHLIQLKLFEKSYLFKRYNNCHNIKCSHQGIVYFFFWHRNKQIDPHPPGKNELAHIIFLSFF